MKTFNAEATGCSIGELLFFLWMNMFYVWNLQDFWKCSSFIVIIGLDSLVRSSMQILLDDVSNCLLVSSNLQSSPCSEHIFNPFILKRLTLSCCQTRWSHSFTTLITESRHVVTMLWIKFFGLSHGSHLYVSHNSFWWYVREKIGPLT